MNIAWRLHSGNLQVRKLWWLNPFLFSSPRQHDRQMSSRMSIWSRQSLNTRLNKRILKLNDHAGGHPFKGALLKCLYHDMIHMMTKDDDSDEIWRRSFPYLHNFKMKPKALTNESHCGHGCNKSAVGRLNHIGWEWIGWIKVGFGRNIAIWVLNGSSFSPQVTLPIHAKHRIHKSSTECQSISGYCGRYIFDTNIMVYALWLKGATSTSMWTI